MNINIENNPLLTIAIPTYNRAKYLDLCISKIYSQINGNDSRIEVIVINNDSPDNTEAIVKKYQRNKNFKYLKNKNNIGPDRNIARCFIEAKGKYVVVFGDDDVFLDGSINKILQLLESAEYGIVHLNVYGYEKDYNNEKPRQKNDGYTIYSSLKKFIKQINYRFTFISGNIINKSIIEKRFSVDKFFYTTNLVQLSWTFDVLFKSKCNVIYNEYLISGKAENTGNIGVCSVFGVNFNKVVDYYTKKGIDKKYLGIINDKLLMYFFPDYIYKIRKSYGTYLQEDYYKILKPVFKRNIWFWIFTVPSIKFPVLLAKYVFYMSVIIKKIERREFGELFEKIKSKII